MKIKKYRVVMTTLEREPAFSNGHFGILHVNSMIGKYRRGVAACMHVFLVYILNLPGVQLRKM